MIGAWMVHGLVVGGLLGGAAALAERALRLSGYAARWTWAATLVGTLALPAWGARTPAPSVAPTTLDGAVVVNAPSLAAPAPRFALPSLRSLAIPSRFDAPLGALWLTLSGATLCSGAIGLSRLARARRGWRPTLVDGRDVLLSERFGPAVMGLLRPQVVLPRWALDLDREERALVLAHEEEHRRARDPLLLALGAAAVAAMPWNPWAWWGARRLRAAVELDCDARVLARGAEPLAYGELLLRVGSRTGRGVGVLAAALTENSGSILERRLTMITRVRGGGWRGTAAVTGAAAVGLMVMACETPSPTTTDAASAVAQAQQAQGMKRTADPTVGAPSAYVEGGAGPALVFVDGVELDQVSSDPLVGPAARIEMFGVTADMIERIEVIKGEAAKGIYGERGRDGVILVFTKGGLSADAQWKTPDATMLGESRWQADGDRLRIDRSGPGQAVTDANVRIGLLEPGTRVLVDGALVDPRTFEVERLTIERMEILTGRSATAVDASATRVVKITTKK